MTAREERERLRLLDRYHQIRPWAIAPSARAAVLVEVGAVEVRFYDVADAWEWLAWPEAAAAIAAGWNRDDAISEGYLGNWRRLNVPGFGALAVRRPRGTS